MSEPAKRVAVIGMGRMGGAMAVRLRDNGTEVVVYNRTRPKAERIADRSGAAVADSAREAADRADVVLVSLSDDTAVLDTYRGADGLAVGLRSDTVVVETSTIDPETARTHLPPLVEERGAAFLDAPVSGSVPAVEQGGLTFMVGGAAESLRRAQPVLDHLAGRVFHMGEHGAGAVMKLAVNAALYGLNQALSEALVLAERAGLPRDAAYDVFAASAVGAPFLNYKRAAFEHPEETPVAFGLDLVAKDLDLIQRLAARVGATVRQAEANDRVAREAIAAGLGDRDMSAIAAYLRR
ncbi:MAG: NAD-binding protein [Streptosporangiales bacterium]|nr:NAD-binding protein [Streptosporangiales bacterium]